MTTAAGTGKRVLVVDDERSIRELLKSALKEVGFTVEAVETGEAAIEALGKSSYDLLIVDKNLPGMSGHDVARRARSLAADLAIAMLTAHDERIKPEDVGNLDNYIVKSFRSIKDIQNAASLTLELRALARQQQPPSTDKG